MTPSELKKSFSELMLEGINITRQAQEGNAIYAEKERLDSVFRLYQIWKSRVKDFIADTGKNTLEWYKFYEANSVPDFKGGPEYGDIQSEKSQTLLRNIRIETTAILALLNDLGKSIFGKSLPKEKLSDPDVIELKTKKNIFSFNPVTGNARLNDVKTTFPPGLQKFCVLAPIVTGKENQAYYPEICKSLGVGDSKAVRFNIAQLIKEIKTDLKILPRNKKINEDIFYNIPKKGYRLIVT